jgi:phosphoribosylglycinamide formyltransferase-1
LLVSEEISRIANEAGCQFEPVLTEMDSMRVVILGSGTGSNAKAILQAQRDGALGTAQVVQIIADKPDAGILAHGETFGVPARYLDPAPFKTKLEGAGEDLYIDTIRALGADLVVLAGFMRVIKPRFINEFAGKIINLHPSLLPSFPGLDGIGQAWRRGVKISGCSVHYVTAEVDGGPIIDQATVRIEPEDTLVTFEEKIHTAEHQLLPAVIARLSEDG